MIVQKSFRVRGLSPLVLHNGQTASPINRFAIAMREISGKRKKTESDYLELARIEWMAGLYTDASGRVIMPAINIEAALVKAARTQKLGPAALAGISVFEDAIIDGPHRGKPAEDLWADESYRLVATVCIQRSRVVRTRPMFRDWSMSFRVDYNDALLSERQVDQLVDVAGRQIGLGDWRPRFGRFEVE